MIPAPLIRLRFFPSSPWRRSALRAAQLSMFGCELRPLGSAGKSPRPLMPPFGAPRTCSHSRPSIPAVGRCSAGSGCPLPCPTRRVQCACSGSRSMVDPSWRSEIGGGRMSFVIPEETMCSSFGERVFLSMLQAEPSSVRLRGGHSRSRERRDCCVLRGQIRD